MLCNLLTSAFHLGMDFSAVEEMIHSVDIQRKGYVTKAEYVLWVERLIHDGSLRPF